MGLYLSGLLGLRDQIGIASICNHAAQEAKVGESTATVSGDCDSKRVCTFNDSLDQGKQSHCHRCLCGCKWNIANKNEP
jgi:hypothetical protein